MNNLIEVERGQPDGSLFTIEQIKTWGSIDGDALDSVIQDAIDGITDLAQQELNCSLLERTIKATYESTAPRVALPYGPVIKIESVTDLSGDPIPYQYRGGLLAVAGRGCIVTYTAGYDPIPEGIRQALKQAILTAINDREDNALGGVSHIPTSSRRKLMKYRRY